MTPTHVTPEQIAQVSGVTEKHVRRMICRAEGRGPYVNPLWFGVRMNVTRDEDDPKVTFASLPVQIREAFVMLDQPELSLPPHRSKKIEINAH